MKRGLASAALAVSGLVVCGLPANAATVSFVGSADGTDFKITFDDDIAGQIGVGVTATASPNYADLLGLGFDWGGPALAAGDFNSDGSNTGEEITQVCFSTLSCGGGLNFEGTGVSAFDVIVRMGDQGTQGGVYLTSFNFHFDTAGTLDDLGDTFGIRAQSSGDDGKGSIKLVTFTRVDVPEVPLPAAGILLVAGLGALGATRRRRKPGH